MCGELMAVEIYIVSGFLGAGKTTLMKHLVTEVFQKEKVVIIENDFGDVNVDAAVLREYDVEVSALSAGCICCSLAGNFVNALERMIKKYNPTVIMVEPSGVGKLSDILLACQNSPIIADGKQVTAITVVDVRCMEKYMKNYGEFYYDQLSKADYLWLSHIDKSTNVLACKTTLQAYGASGRIYTYDEKKLPKEFIHRLRNLQERTSVQRDSDVNSNSRVGLIRNRNEKSMQKGFQSTTIHSAVPYDLEQIQAKFNRLEREEYGTIIRAKGVIQGKDGYYEVQYLPGDLQIVPVSMQGNSLVFIGENLRKNKLHFLFRGGL